MYYVLLPFSVLQCSSCHLYKCRPTITTEYLLCHYRLTKVYSKDVFIQLNIIIFILFLYLFIYYGMFSFTTVFVLDFIHNLFDYLLK